MANGNTSGKSGYNPKGSPKQINWAENIIDDVKKIMNDFEKTNEDNPLIKQLREMHKKVIVSMENEHAGNIIDDFKDVRYTGNPEEDYRYFVTQLNMIEKTTERRYRK